MSDLGDIHLADLNEERRRRVLVDSTRRFQQMSGRVLVAPELPGPPDDIPFPWRVEVDDSVFAVDLIRSIPVERLLEATGRAPADAVRRARQALHAIT